MSKRRLFQCFSDLKNDWTKRGMGGLSTPLLNLFLIRGLEGGSWSRIFLLLIFTRIPHPTFFPDRYPTSHSQSWWILLSRSSQILNLIPLYSENPVPENTVPDPVDTFNNLFLLWTITIPVASISRGGLGASSGGGFSSTSLINWSSWALGYKMQGMQLSLSFIKLVLLSYNVLLCT